jgi:hypothetical protein
MAAEFDRVINCGLFRGKRRLIIKEQFLFFEKNKVAVNPTQAFGSDEITGYSYEIQWIRFRLVFGRRYVIRVRNKSGKVLTIKMTRYFRIGANAAHKEFNEIVSTIRRHYFDRVINQYLEHHQNDQAFTIENVNFSKEGIAIPTEFKLAQPVFLPWENIRTKNYYTYFAVYAASEPRNKNFSFSYANDWNTSILYSVLRVILKQKNIETY